MVQSVNNSIRWAHSGILMYIDLHMPIRTRHLFWTLEINALCHFKKTISLLFASIALLGCLAVSNRTLAEFPGNETRLSQANIVAGLRIPSLSDAGGNAIEHLVDLILLTRAVNDSSVLHHSDACSYSLDASLFPLARLLISIPPRYSNDGQALIECLQTVSQAIKTPPTETQLKKIQRDAASEINSAANFGSKVTGILAVAAARKLLASVAPVGSIEQLVGTLSERDFDDQARVRFARAHPNYRSEALQFIFEHTSEDLVGKLRLAGVPVKIESLSVRQAVQSNINELPPTLPQIPLLLERTTPLLPGRSTPSELAKACLASRNGPPNTVRLSCRAPIDDLLPYWVLAFPAEGTGSDAEAQVAALRALYDVQVSQGRQSDMVAFLPVR